MVRKYVRLLEEREINEKTGSVWAIGDVPGTWREKARAAVVADGYEFGEDGTATYPDKGEGNE